MALNKQNNHSPIFFVKDSRTVVIILIVATITSIILANFVLGASYRNFWMSEIERTASLHLPENHLEWINNFRMGIFF